MFLDVPRNRCPQIFNRDPTAPRMVERTLQIRLVQRLEQRATCGDLIKQFEAQLIQHPITARANLFCIERVNVFSLPCSAGHCAMDLLAEASLN